MAGRLSAQNALYSPENIFLFLSLGFACIRGCDDDDNYDYGDDDDYEYCCNYNGDDDDNDKCLGKTEGTGDDDDND
jgi:hypothetical protein